ncbi:GH25 family lysozyme [Furfurilactobacillus sp. WILCCON 0119]
MTFKKKLMMMGAVMMAAFCFAVMPKPVAAASGNLGTDTSVYNGFYAVKGADSDTFSVAQIGGYTGAGLYDQTTYNSQVSTGIAAGLRMHTYIWWQNVTTQWQADDTLNYFLPRVQTPKGSIVALDVEAGGQDTAVLDYALNRIKEAGYTPMLYGYKNYLQTTTDLQYLSSKYQLWLAEYPDYAVTPFPNYNYFPSFNNVGIFQFTSTRVAGGLDGNVDLTGITDNGYTKHDNPKTDTPAANQGEAIKHADSDYMQSGTFTADQTVNVRTEDQTSASVTGQLNGGDTIYYDHVFIAGGYVWAHYINYRNQDRYVAMGVDGGDEFGSRSTSAQTTSQRLCIVEPGDSWWQIAQQFGDNMDSLAALNGQSIDDVIYPGQVLYY